MSRELDLCKRQIAREKNARTEAEKLLEKKSLELFEANKKLSEANSKLSGLLEERTNKLLRSEQEYKALVESVSDIICKTDLKGNVIYVNPVVCRITGYTTNEITGKNIFTFIPQEHRRKTIMFYHNQQKKNCFSYNELPINTKDGGILWLGLNVQFFEEKCSNCLERFCSLLQKSPLPSKKDCLYKEVIIVARDITDQKRTEKLLILQSRRLEKGLIHQELVSEIALELNYLKSFESRIQSVIGKIGNYTNSSRVYIFENINDGKTTRNIFEWCNKGIEPQIRNLQNIRYSDIPSWKKLLLDEGHIFSNNISLLPGDIKQILKQQGIKSIIVYPIFIEDEFFGFIGFDDCISNKEWSKSELQLLRTVSGIVANTFERKKMEAKILDERDKANKANRAKSEFLANMSHEIRTPMNAILGLSEALYQKLDEPKHKRILQSVLTSGNLLLSLLNDILDLSKVEAGKIELSLSPSNIKSLIDDIVLLFSEKAKEKEITILKKYDKNVPDYLLFDEIRMKQILFNLIGNAIKFTHEGHVSIELKVEQETKLQLNLVIQVKDTGIGIPPDEHQNIFEAFKQQSGITSRKYGGAGLGLAISKRLVEKMEGQITLNSESGKGAIFTILLPKIKKPKKPLDLKKKQPIVQDISFNGAKLLLVDDNHSNLNAFQNLLDDCELSIKTVAHAISIAKVIQDFTPDIIFLDIRMPDIDGFEAAKIIRKTKGFKDIPIIAYTALVFNKKEILESSCFNGVLNKPSVKNDIVNLLMKYLKYTVKVQKPIQPKEGDSIWALPPMQAEKFNEIKEELSTTFHKEWLEIKDTFIIFKIENFVDKLSSFSNKNNIGYLKKYSKKLSDDIDIFDLDSLKKDLNFFGRILEQFSIKTKP